MPQDKNVQESWSRREYAWLHDPEELLQDRARYRTRRSLPPWTSKHKQRCRSDAGVPAEGAGVCLHRKPSPVAATSAS